MSKDLEEFYKRYSARIVEMDDTPLVKVFDGGKFKILSIEEYEKLTNELAILEKALELAVSQLDDAKDMLRECGKNDWANTLDTSADYFKARAKGDDTNA